MSRRVRMFAVDAEDLTVISALVQDGLTRTADMLYLPRRRRFALLVNRFKWEKDGREAGRSGHERTLSLLQFDAVQQVKLQNIDQNDRRGLLPLLAVAAEEDGEGTRILLHFSGGGTVLLRVECVDGMLCDVRHGWRTGRRPRHPLEEAS